MGEKSHGDICPCCQREPCRCKFEPRKYGIWCERCRCWWPHGLLREPEPRKGLEEEH